MAPAGNALSPRDLAERAPLWAALTQLWLDAELDDADVDGIAAVIAAAPSSFAGSARHP